MSSQLGAVLLSGFYGGYSTTIIDRNDWREIMTRTVKIKFDGQEYRVPAVDGKEEGAYYTDDREDALGTAKNFIWKDEKATSFKIVNGTWY